MMMAPPQVVGVLLKKPGEQNHSRLSPLDPQDTKIRGELYVEDLNERRIVSVRMGYLWVEGTQMRLPLRALNLRQATSGICQPHVLALGFTLSNSQGDLVATFWADTEPIYWSWVRAIAAELVRQTPFRAQRCLNFLEILTICPRGPVPLPDSPTETRRRSRSELRCWLGGGSGGGGGGGVGGDDSPISGAKSARAAASMLVEDSRRRARSELRGWSSSNSSDEDLLHLGEFRGIETALLPKVETAVLAARTWGCSESSEGSDDSLPWGAGCRSSVDSIDSAPSLPEADTRELRIQRYKEARRRENEARSRRVLEEDAKRRKARQEENNNNNNNNNNHHGSSNNIAKNNNNDENAEATQRCAGRLCDDARNNGNNSETTANNAGGTPLGVPPGGDDVGLRLADTATVTGKTTTTEREKVSRNNRNNARATRTTASANCPTETAVEQSARTSREAARPRNGGNNGETTRTATTTTIGSNAVAGRLSDASRDRATSRSRDASATVDRNNAETTKTTSTTTATTNSADKTTSSETNDARWLMTTTGESVRTARETAQTRDRRNNAETTRATTKTTRASATETVATPRSAGSRTADTTESSSRETTTTTTTTTATTATTTNPFVRAAETVDAITRRLPPLRAPADAPIVRFREINGQDDARNNNNNSKSTGNYNNNARGKADSPPSPGVVRTDSGERRSRARERRNVREKSQQQQQQQQQQPQQPQQQQQQPRIPENSLKTTFLQERRERLSQMSRIPIASQDSGRTSSSSRCLLERSLESLRERGAISLPRAATFATVDEDEKSSSSCEDDVARLLERCQRVDRYVPVREKLTLFESLSRMGGRLARSTEDLGRSSARPSPRGKQRARSLHDLNRAARSVPVREMCRLFEGEQEAGDQRAIVLSTGHSRLGDAAVGRIGGKDPPTSILKNTNGGGGGGGGGSSSSGSNGQDVPPCVRTSTRRKHYQK